jgi:hypothetical protein
MKSYKSMEEEGFIKIKKGTLVLIVVALIFVGILSFVIWDLSPSDDLESQIFEEEKPEEPPERPDEQGVPPEESSSSEEIDSSTSESCIGNTRDEPECKDCCDCLDSDSSVKTTCRDECAVSDFSGNSDFITVSAPSVLGLDGDYSECVSLGEERECKICCESSMELQCGDYRHCRTACNEAFG